VLRRDLVLEHRLELRKAVLGAGRRVVRGLDRTGERVRVRRDVDLGQHRAVAEAIRRLRGRDGQRTGCPSVEAAAKRATNAVRSGGGPHFLEFRTYRFRAHSMYDPELYRTKEEVEAWKKRDPIPNFAASLKEQGLLKDEDLARMEEEVAAEITRAVEFAEAGTWEPVEELTRFVYSEEPKR